MIKKKYNFRGMRFKLISSLVGICLVPLVTFGSIAYTKSANMFEENITTATKQNLDEIDMAINNYFTSMENPVKILSTNTNFANIDTDTNSAKAVQELLNNFCSIDKSILGVYVGTESGKFLQSPDSPLESGYDPRVRPWYKDALAKSDSVIITDPYKDSGTDNMVVTFAKAVKKDNKVVGVIGLDLSLDSLASYISSIKVGKTGYVYITDPNGNMISNPDKTLIGGNSATQLAFWNVAKSNASGISEYTFKDQDKLAIFKTNEMTGWKMFVSLTKTEITESSDALMKIMLVIASVVAVIAVLLAALISRGILKNLNLLKNAFSKAAEGDLTQSLVITSKDEFKELGDDFNHMTDNISILMKNVKASSQVALQTSTNLAAMAEETNSSLGEVANAVHDIADGATNQSQSALTGVKSMEELSEMLNFVSESTLELAKASNNTKDLSTQGLDMVKTLTEKSSKTKNASIEVGKVVLDMNKSVAQINAISQTIAGITEQTNLLSLNASIEAARAGEAGRGFAIVADEIRKLADASNKSTEEIKQIIEAIQKKSEIAVSAIEETKTIVIEQETSVSETQKIFDNIINLVITLTHKLEEIKNSTVHITKRKDAVLQQMEDISSISEETAAASEEVSASTQQISIATNEFTNHADELQAIAQKLEEEINKFKIK